MKKKAANKATATTTVVTPPPVAVAIDPEDKTSIHIHVTGGAALALRAGAVMDGQSLEYSLTWILASQAAMTLGDTNPNETPAYAALFGLEGRAA